VIGFEGDKPVILGKWRATTEPGAYYTEHPVNPAGAARIEFGQYQAWRVGMHRGDHEALVQRSKVTVCRDLNKDMIRTGDARDSGDNFGINQHGPSGTDEAPDNVGNFSAGCLVGKSMAGHRAFMAIVKADPSVRRRSPKTLIGEALPSRAGHPIRQGAKAVRAGCDRLAGVGGNRLGRAPRRKPASPMRRFEIKKSKSSLGAKARCRWAFLNKLEFGLN
jgi:hypothetical protein